MFFADRKLHGSHTNLHNLSEHASEKMKLSEHELNNRQVIEHALADQHACIPVSFQPRFYEYLYQHTYQSLRHIHLLGQLAFLLYFFADLFIIPDLALISGLTRVGVALGLWLISELLFRYSKDIRLLDMIMPIATTLCAGIWMIMLVTSTSPHVANYLYASAIFLLIIHLSTKVQFKVSLYCSLFIGLFVLITMTQIMTLSEAFTFAVVLTPILLFSVYMNWTNIINMRRAFLRTLLDEWNYHAVHKLAHTDDLTQLYNRRHFVNLAEHSIHEWPTPSSSCLLMFDVDHFKQINDNYGHDVGDRVLQVIAETTRKEMRHSDVLARFGGEEFIVLLSDTQLQDALLIAERIRHSIQRQYVSVQENQPLQFTVSIGVAELESPSQSLNELIKQADIALYAAKRAGRNRIRVYRSEMESAPSKTSQSITS